jgi:trigger factor
MHSQVSEIDPVTVEIQVEVPWDRVQKNLDETFTKLQRSARIKGFRPGKAPRSVLQRLFSKDVRAEVVSNLIEATLYEAVQQHSLPVVSSAMMDAAPPELAEGQPLSFKVKFEVKPKVEKLDLGLALTRTSVQVSEAEVDAEIERLREQNAIVRALESERPAARGDILSIDYEIEIDGAARTELAREDTTINLGDPRTLPELEAGLLGAATGDRREIAIERPESDSNKELAGKKLVFKIAVKEIRERILPDLDDEFAKDLGEYETLAALRAKTREKLEEAARERSENELRNQAIEKLAEANPIPVPPSLIDQQLRVMLREYLQIMKMIGQSPDPDDFGVEEMRKRAEKRVRAGLLLAELSRSASISVDGDEVEAKMRELAERSGKHIAKIKAEYAGEKRATLENQLLEDKLIKHLLDQATITDAPAGEGALTKGAAEPQE